MRKNFNPWLVHYKKNNRKQCFPSQILSDYLEVKIHEDYPYHYENKSPEEIANIVDKETDKLYNWYCKKYTKFKKIKIVQKWHKSDIVRGIISKFTYDDIKHYVERDPFTIMDIYRANDNYFGNEYHRQYYKIITQLNIEFGYIPSLKTLNLIVEKKNLK